MHIETDIYLTREQREYLVWGENISGYEVVDPEYFLFMDSQGIDNNLCIFKKTDGDQLYAFQWGSLSQESFFGKFENDKLNEEFPVFEVVATPITVMRYSRRDGLDWDSLNSFA